MTYPESLTALLTRRSVSVKDLIPPMPTEDELTLILRAATRVPDHGKLCPWKLIVLKEAGQQKLGGLGADIFKRTHPDATDAELAHEQARFGRAPLCIAVLSTPKQGGPKVKPVWEQELSAGAVCMNILHAVHALGYGAKWLSEWVAYNAEIIAALGGGAEDKVAGFIYIGTKTEEPDDRERPALKDVVEYR